MTYFQCGPLMTCGGLEYQKIKGGGVHDSCKPIPVQTSGSAVGVAVLTGGGIFYFPWHRHQIEGTNGFYCLIRKTLASRVNGIGKVPKRKVFTEVGLEPSNVRSTPQPTRPPVSGQVGDKSTRRHPTRRQVDSATSNSATTAVNSATAAVNSATTPLVKSATTIENTDNGPKYISLSILVNEFPCY